MRRLLYIALAVAAPLPLHASNPDMASGNFMLTACTSDSSLFSGGLCRGRLEGLVVAEEGQRQKVFCAPEDATNRQILDVYVAYLRDNPALRHLRWDRLAIVAFHNAWLCPDQKPVVLLPDGKLAVYGVGAGG